MAMMTAKKERRWQKLSLKLIITKATLADDEKKICEEKKISES